LENGDQGAVQGGAEGVNFTEVGRLAGPANDGGYQTASFNILPYRSATTTVRLVSRFTVESSAYLPDVVYVDDVKVSFTAAASGNSYPTLAGLETLHAA